MTTSIDEDDECDVAGAYLRKLVEELQGDGMSQEALDLSHKMMREVVDAARKKMINPDGVNIAMIKDVIDVPLHMLEHFIGGAPEGPARIAAFMYCVEALADLVDVRMENRIVPNADGETIN